MLEIKHQSTKSAARSGRLITPHGEIQTPFFMTIATTGAVKTLDNEMLKQMNAQILLSNTYHLYLRPGTELMQEVGGLHHFMNWQGPILTDSGGYQVFSLAKMRKITEEGAKFQSHVDGSRHMLTPEKSIDVQLKLGSDMLMVLDECPPHTKPIKYLDRSLEMTTRWAKRSYDYFWENYERLSYGGEARPLLFGIVQGGMHLDLREKSLQQLNEIPFDGMAIGGVSVGETPEEMRKVINHMAPLMPKDKPRYIMGVGFPHDIVDFVKAGADMFDCVIPTRHARHASLFVFTDRNSVGDEGHDFYEMLSIKGAKFKTDFDPIDKNCECLTCKNYSRAYIRYLFSIGEMLAYRLATIHNAHFYIELMQIIREKIQKDEF